jgi:hypothetical protein
MFRRKHLRVGVETTPVEGRFGRRIKTITYVSTVDLPMTEWKHRIPITKFFPEDGDTATTVAMEEACRAIRDSLIENRAFLSYVELSEEEIMEFTNIAEDFYMGPSKNGRSYVCPVQEFDSLMDDLYNWADRNGIWID